MLGTLVEITLDEPDAQRAQQAFDAAFCAIERVQQLMSAHDPASELRQLSQRAHRTPMRVHPDTACVLRLAQAVHAESQGIFDVTVGTAMAGAGHVPPLTHPHAQACGNTSDIVIGPGDEVAFKRPLHLDFGGIAKGYAVDCAVRALQARGIAAALVNAGGDMRAFGPPSHPVQLRFAGGVRTVAELRDGAIAASCNAAEPAHAPTAHLDARSGRAARRRYTVVVHARSAAVADALTKVAMVCASTADRACLAMRAQWRSFDYFAA